MASIKKIDYKKYVKYGHILEIYILLFNIKILKLHLSDKKLG